MWGGMCRFRPTDVKGFKPPARQTPLRRVGKLWMPVDEAEGADQLEWVRGFWPKLKTRSGSEPAAPPPRARHISAYSMALALSPAVSTGRNRPKHAGSRPAGPAGPARLLDHPAPRKRQSAAASLLISPEVASKRSRTRRPPELRKTLQARWYSKPGSHLGQIID